MQESTVVVIVVIVDDDGVRVKVALLLLLLSLLCKIGRAGKERESAIVVVLWLKGWMMAEGESRIDG